MTFNANFLNVDLKSNNFLTLSKLNLHTAHTSAARRANLISHGDDYDEGNDDAARKEQRCGEVDLDIDDYTL